MFFPSLCEDVLVGRGMVVVILTSALRGRE